jgi:hypothetical protein
VSDIPESVHEKVHPVEKEYHYPYMVAHRYVAITREAKGLVRSYEWEGPKGQRIRYCVGYYKDYWMDVRSGNSGNWPDLERHLESIA